MTIEELREALEYSLTVANEDATESHETAPNSYGAGYECGYRDALQKVLNTINDEEENVL